MSKEHSKVDDRVAGGRAGLLAATLFLAAAAAGASVQAADRGAKPLKIYILSGQSNMVGMGTLDSLEPLATDPKFKSLKDGSGKWTVREDVYYVSTYLGRVTGWLTAGLANKGKRVGPELGIGHVLGDHHDETILVLKIAQGNRSLGFDAMAPRSQKRLGIDDRDQKWYHGWQYDAWMKNAKGILGDLEGHYPGYKGQGYEIAGFFWWQGHKDKGMAKEKYETLLAEFIEDFRKDFNAPDAPFVVATIGFNGHNLGAWKGVFEGQMAVSDAKRHPRFAGNVASVDIRDIGGGGYHYGNNASTYTKVGDAMGRAMVGLLKAREKKEPTPHGGKSIAAAPAGELRKWTSVKGLKFEARVVEYRDGTALLRRPSGARVRVSDKRLSEADRKYLTSWAGAASK